MCLYSGDNYNILHYSYKMFTCEVFTFCFIFNPKDLLTYEEEPKEITDDKVELREHFQSHDGDSSIDNSLDEEISATRNSSSANYPAKKSISTTHNSGSSLFAGKKNLPTLTPIMGLGHKKFGEIKGNLSKVAGDSNTFPRTAQLSINRFRNVGHQQDAYDDIFKSDDSTENKMTRPESNIKTVPTVNKNVKLTRQTSDIIDLSFNPSKTDGHGSDDELTKSTPKKGFALTGLKIIF